MDKLQRILNSTFNRSVNAAPFDLLFGVKMCDETDLKLREIIEQEFQSKFEEERNEIRARMKEQCNRRIVKHIISDARRLRNTR